jgi:ribosome-binding factor A
MPSNRPLKVADRIKEVLATALEGHVKDPRLGFITLTDVRVTGDLQHASIFYTVLGDESASEATAAALHSAKGMLRSEVGKALGLRIVPTLEFIPDALGKSASAMNDLISQMHQRDEELARLRQDAKPVGESDPYKHHQ